MPKCSFSLKTTDTKCRKIKNQFTEKKIVREHCRISLALLHTSQRQDPIETVRERARLAKKKHHRRTRKNGTAKWELNIKFLIDTSIVCKE